MADIRHERFQEMLVRHTAEFFTIEAGLRSLITITRVSLSDDQKHAIVFFTTIPESEEENALSFTKRKRTELRAFLKKKLKLRSVPFLEMHIDKGERNRQIIDGLTLGG